MTVPVEDLDELFELFEFKVQAFAVCEIGRAEALQCAPHDEIVVHFVLHGSGNVECEFGQYQLRPGTLIIVPPQTAKLLAGIGPVENISPAEATCSLSEGIARFRSAENQVDLLLGCAMLATTVRQCLPGISRLQKPVLANLHGRQVQSLFAAMLHEVSEPRPGTRAFLSAAMKQLLILALRLKTTEEGDLAIERADADVRLQSAVAAVLRAPAAIHSVESLAGVAGMSRARFSARFSAAYGCPPIAFVRTARLAAAAKMLRNSALPVKAIAAAVGYASRSQFTRAFKEKYGQEPSQFRR